MTQFRTWLGLKWIWLRNYYPFAWAHKPLCERFRHDVIRLGHVHLCRSCCLAYVGVFGALLAIVLLPTLQSWLRSVFLVGGFLTVLFSLPVWYKRWPRVVRDVLRFSMGAMLACGGMLCFYGDWLVGGVGMLVMAAFWKLYLHQRAKRKLHSCQGCEEYGRDEICSGYTFQADCIRQYEEQATDLVQLTFSPQFKR